MRRTLELRAKAVFEAALVVPEEQRADLVRRECAGDETLRAHVESLLVRHDQLGDFMVEPVALAAAAIAGGEDDEDRWLGQQLGPYRLDALLGEGGMGRVYRAEQTTPFHRLVAVKVLRQVHFQEGRRRFDEERAILAQLRHPRIARLLDGGSAADGTPFLVMDLVEGLPVTEHSQRQGLSLTARLELFRQVCEAVAAAHRQLVVHRDIKPSNVLVNAAGEPFLVDFGIAKLLEPADRPSAARTSTQVRVLTPAYASPEQLIGAPVSTATDVYGLGLLLFELLTGGPPRGRLPRAPVLPVEPAAWPEPPLPSAAVGESGAGQASAAPEISFAPSVGGLSAAGLQRRLRGDLDAILDRCLRPSPEERYSSAQELADDLGRHLAGEPIRARRSSALYRLGKLVRRRAAASVAIAAALLAILAFGVSSRYQLVQVSRERAATQAARLDAEKARADIEQVLDILLGSFALNSSPVAERGMVPVREIVAAAASRADQLDGSPDLQASLRHAVGVAYYQLGLYAESRAAFEQALRGRRARFGGGDEKTLETLLASTSPLRALGDLAVAEQRARLVRAMRERELGPDHPATAAAMYQVAQLMMFAGRYPESLELAQRALKVHRAQAGTAPDDVIADLDLMARDYAHLERYELADQALRESLALVQGHHGEDSREAAELYQALGVSLTEQGRFGEAEPLLQRSRAQLERILGPDHPDVATVRLSLGVLRQQSGDLTGALGDVERALAIRRAVYPEDYPDVAHALNAVANVEHKLGRLDDAERHWREALTMRRRLFAPGHPQIAEACDSLAQAVNQRGHWEEAEALRREALAIKRATLSPDSLQIAITIHNLASTVWNRGDAEEAERLFREAIGLCRSRRERAGADCSPMLTTLSALRRRRGDLAEAEQLAREAVAARHALLGDDHPDTGQSRVQLAAALAVAGRPQEALTEVEQGLAALRGALPASHWRVGHAEVVRGLVRAALGEPAGVAEAERGRQVVLASQQPAAAVSLDAADLVERARRSADVANRRP